MTNPTPLLPASDTIEIAEVVRTVRRGWRIVAGCVAAGLLLAIGVMLFAPRRYEASSTVLIKAGSESGSLLSRVGGGVGEMLGGAGLDLGKSVMETEIQVLDSRALAGQTVDSLRLQVRVSDPAGTPPRALVQGYTLEGSFAPRTFSFTRVSQMVHQVAGSADSMFMGKYRVESDDFRGELTQGFPGRIPLGALTLATTKLPESFTLKLYDREDAVTRFQKRLDVGKAGGEVARVRLRADDRETAAEAPNTLLDIYLARRKTVDRGTNQKRVEFLSEQVAALSGDLTAAERALRAQQERSGVLDAGIIGRVSIEQAAELRKSLIDVQVEEGAIRQLLARAQSGNISGRELAAYPAFLRGASLNSLVAQLAELEAEKQRLLERRTERDPEVVALTQSIRTIEGQFVPMAQSYAAALTRQRMDLSTQLDSMQTAIMALPSAAESGGRLQREVARLSGIHAAVQAQLVQARLAAIDEGGEVRRLDTAVPPRKPIFPRPVPTLGAGLGGGLAIGLIAALLMSWFGRWVRDPLEIERATGVPTQRLAQGAPLLMPAAQAVSRTILVVPVEERAIGAGGAVVERLVRTANSRAMNATALDLATDPSHVAGNGVSPSTAVGAPRATGISALIDELQQQHAMVVVRLPGLASEATVAALRDDRPVLLVAPPDRVDRARLMGAVETLRRLQIPCAGIVVGDAVTPVA